MIEIRITPIELELSAVFFFGFFNSLMMNPVSQSSGLPKFQHHHSTSRFTSILLAHYLVLGLDSYRVSSEQL